MRFSLTLFILTAVTAVQALVIPRDATPILSALDTITNQLHTVGDLVEVFTGGFNGTFAALKIQGETGELGTAINKGVTAIKNIQPLNEADSAQVVNVVVALQSDIYGLLDLLVQKKPAFDRAIFGIGSASFLVKIDLQNLRKSTAQLGDAITSKLVDEFQRLAPLITSSIDFHFSQALDVYA
ncbi:hydrophobic surface binding protein A-domain-containing protein [Aspergillus pseudodeflectus]|uniref:Hydrophobic surface binding protein A-domain-containing protein n=1 Tax=Aspergillus pseudodeflectus TaxID=176178 RepID=A0ABR4KBW0_9EURO